MKNLFGADDFRSARLPFKADDYPNCTSFFARVCFVAKDGASSMVDSAWVEVREFTYEEAADGAGMVITGYLGKKANVVIPDEIGGKPVVAIGDWAFRDNSTLTAVHIPQGVTAIGSGAFYGCQSLMTIEIPGGVTAIQEQTFENCTALTNAVLPDGVTVIGRAAFKNCPNLMNIVSR